MEMPVTRYMCQEYSFKTKDRVCPSFSPDFGPVFQRGKWKEDFLRQMTRSSTMSTMAPVEWASLLLSYMQDPDVIYVLPTVEEAGYIVQHLDSHMEETTECLRVVVQHHITVEGL